MYILGVRRYNSEYIYYVKAHNIAEIKISKHFIMKLLFYVLLFILSTHIQAQTEQEQIRATIQNYIDGTAYNNIPLINKAFHDSTNLYLDGKKNELRIVPIKAYVSWFKNGTLGKFNGRIGSILSIDHFENLAFAKAEILIPKRNVQFIDMFLLKKLKGQWQIISKSAASKPTNKQGDRILFVVSNAHFYGNSKLKTGNSFAEIVNAYHTFITAGYTIDFVSPKGGAIPLAYIDTSDELQKQYVYNSDFMSALEHTSTPTSLEAKNYKAVHYIGGGSAMFGVPENTEIHKLVMGVYEDHNGIISSVCHGTAGIVHLKTKDGKYLVDGKRINGYPDAYERRDKAYFKTFPFQITKTIEAHGGIFKYSPRNTPHVEVQGHIVTGQNYLSSKLVAEKIITLLKSKK